MADARELKGELRRLVLARTDIESADALLMMLAASPPLPPRVDREAVRLGLWTGALVSYARPFKRAGMSVAPEWSEFADHEWLGEMHRQFLTMRDRLFAHNDAMPLRSVQVVPPREAREQRSTLTGSTVNHLKRLCAIQLERIGSRIDTLATELSRGQGWPDGEPVDLPAIPDSLRLQPLPSPFQIPNGPGGHRRDEAG